MDRLEERDKPSSLQNTELSNAETRRSDQQGSQDRGVYPAVDDALQVLRKAFTQQLTDHDEVSKREKASLYSQLNVLRRKTARVDEILAENERLRRQLEGFRTSQVIETRAAFAEVSATEWLANHPQVETDAKKEVSTGPETVSVTSYKAVHEKCEKLRKQLDLANKQGGNYKHSYAKLKNHCERLKAQHQADKAKVKEWQGYLQRLENKRRDATNTYGVRGGFWLELDSPDLLPPSAMDTSIRTFSSSVPFQPRVPAPKGGEKLPEEDWKKAQHTVGINPPELPPDVLFPAGPTTWASSATGGDSELQTELRATFQERRNQASAGDDRAEEGILPVSSASRTDAKKKLDVSNASLVIESSQTTEDEEDVDGEADPPCIAPDAESDPIVISSRVIRRKRQAENEKYGDIDHAICIKHESNSSPFSYSAIARLFTADSLDLDDFQGAIVTPRKKRKCTLVMSRLEPLESSLELANAANPEKSTSTPIVFQGGNPLENDFAPPQTDLQQCEPILRSVQSEPPRYFPRSADVMPSSQEGRFERCKRSHGSPRSPKPLSASMQVLPQTSIKRPKAQTPRRSGLIMQLAEGNESFVETNDATSASLEQSRTTAQDTNPMENRLTTFLETHSTNKEFLTPYHDIEKVIQQSVQSTNRPPIKSIDFRKTLRTSLRTPQTTKGFPNPIDPNEESLRLRPINTLALDDFKINPNSNQGYNYAFTEVVRNHDQRRCLPNCTRPECCGNRFRKMLEIGGIPAPKRQLWDSSQTDDDQRLLEEYLGGDSSRLKSLSAEEKREMLLTAKAEQFANTYGKHRHAFARPRTPPGYWRTDFPTTQENEADRAQSRKLDREKVEERYREAMRPNGRWMFRDE